MNAIDGSTHVAQTSVAPPSLLVIVLDTNPHAWSALSPTLSLPSVLAAVQIFINAHLAFSTDNRVAVIAAHTDRAAWLYPSPSSSPSSTSPNLNGPAADGDDDDDKEARKTRDELKAKVRANKYLPFAAVERQVTRNLQALLRSTSVESLREAQKSGSFSTRIAGALTLALSYINKTTLVLATESSTSASVPSAADAAAQQANASPVNSRILVLSTSGDLAGQYIPLMNLIFGAQHSRVLIDILKLAGDSVLLQQASFTTGGIFTAPDASASEAEAANGERADKGAKPRPPTTATALLQYLMQAFLPDPYVRQFLLPPTSPHVDFRAACFCHQRVVDVGYVCSICLSIFCEDLRRDLGLDSWAGKDGSGIECLTCGTRLVLSDAGTQASKKEKRKEKEKDKDKDKGKRDKHRDKQKG